MRSASAKFRPERAALRASMRRSVSVVSRSALPVLNQVAGSVPKKPRRVPAARRSALRVRRSAGSVVVLARAASADSSANALGVLRPFSSAACIAAGGSPGAGSPGSCPRVRQRRSRDCLAWGRLLALQSRGRR